MALLKQSAYRSFPQAQYELGQTYEDYNFWGKNLNHSSKKCIY